MVVLNCDRPGETQPSQLSKRSATRSNTAISIHQSVVSTELKAVVTTEKSASHKGEAFVQETEVTICNYRGALEL